MAGMGLKELRRRLTASVEELDAARLQQRFVGLDLTPIGQIVPRTPVRAGGEVKRMAVVPRHGIPSFEVVVDDGTGELIAVFTGHRRLGGVEHGRGIVLEGVTIPDRGRKMLLNPAYTLLPHA